jgi:hypothetical protein
MSGFFIPIVDDDHGDVREDDAECGYGVGDIGPKETRARGWGFGHGVSIAFMLKSLY